MAELVKILTVVGLGALHMWVAVPTGLAMRLHPAVVAVAAATGASLVVLAVVLAGERGRAWLLRRYGDRLPLAARAGNGRQPWFVRVWQRYGIIGLGLVAPFLPGPPLAAAMALALGVPARRVLLWTVVGIVLWAAGLTLAAALGFEGLARLKP